MKASVWCAVAAIVAVLVGLSMAGAQQPAMQKAFDPFAEQWVHAGETSAVIFWQTGADARNVDATGAGYVEYGPTAAMGKKTAPYSLPPDCKDVPEGVRVFQKPLWSQFHRLTGLEPGKTYHYRMVYVAPDGKETRSKDMTFTTSAAKDVIRLPGGALGAPCVLDKAGATYVLTKDVTADGTAFEITADRVTLDLDGHKVVFGQGAKDNVHGVSVKGRSGVKVFNGVLEEGAGPGGRRFPVILNGCKDIEVAGLSATYQGKDGQGIVFAWQGEGSEVHHNEIYDKGTDTTSRHQQIAGVHFERGGSRSKVHHNIILRARQTGVRYDASQQAAIAGKPEAQDFAVWNNTVYIGACMTNSMGVSASGGVKGFELRNNRIYGRGEMPECVFVGAGASYGKVSGNYTCSRSTGKISKEYGATSSLSAGLRLCWGPHHIEVYENTFVAVAGKTGEFRGSARCIWAACCDSRQPEWATSGEITIRDNVITAMVDPGSECYARAITVCGDDKVSSHGLVFRNNTVTTNSNAVVLSESYGCGSSDVQFIGNTFVKAGDGFKWLSCGFWDKPTTGSAFVDNRFEGGASADGVTFDGTAERNFSVGWTLTVKTAPGADVTIADAAGKEVFSGKADGKGIATAPLMQYRVTPDGKTALTPHTVKTVAGGKVATKPVTMDKAQDLAIRPE